MFVKVVKRPIPNSNRHREYHYLVEKIRENGKAKDRIIRRLTYNEIEAFKENKPRFMLSLRLQEIPKDVSPNREISIKNQLQYLIDQIENQEPPFDSGYRPRLRSFAKQFLKPILEDD